MLLAQAIAAQSGKLREKTSWVQHEKHGRRCFYINFMLILYVFCLFFLFAFFCLGSRMGHQFCPGLTQVGFVTDVFKCPPSRLQKSQNSAGSAYPKHPRAACAAQRRKNLREKRQGKEIGEKFCDSRSAFFQELCSKYSSVSWSRLQTKFPKIIWVPFFKDGIIGILLGANFCLLGFRLTQPLPVQPSPPQAQIQCLNCIFPCQAFLRRILVPIPWNITSFLVEMLVT